jgi:hypothetical protein
VDLDPLVGISNSYAGTFADSLEALLLTIASQDIVALMARLFAGSGEVTSTEQGYCIVSGTRRLNSPESFRMAAG